MSALKETENYRLFIGPLENGNDGYLVRNKDTEVIELEGRVLPQMMQAMDMLQRGLDEENEQLETPVVEIERYNH